MITHRLLIDVIHHRLVTSGVYHLNSGNLDLKTSKLRGQGMKLYMFVWKEHSSICYTYTYIHQTGVKTT